MKKELHRRIQALIEEEQEYDVDQNLLDRLRELACLDPDYWDLTPEQRNTLNQFFKEVKDMMMAEMLSGHYGANILLDTVIVLCFEVGYKSGVYETMCKFGLV